MTCPSCGREGALRTPVEAARDAYREIARYAAEHPPRCVWESDEDSFTHPAAGRTHE